MSWKYGQVRREQDNAQQHHNSGLRPIIAGFDKEMTMAIDKI